MFECSRRTRSLAALAAAWGVAAAAPQTVTRQVASLPRISGPVPQTAASYAFDSAAHAAVPIDLARTGYVEQEYFQSGTAHIYEWPKVGTLESLGSGPYTTRILVRRPRDPRKFNGAVIVEPLNPSMRVDLDLMWDYSHRYLMRKGYAWIGVTVKPVALAALKRFEPTRYAALSLANPLPAAGRCPDPELGPHDVSSEVGLAQDILSQLGALVRSDDAANPLRGYEVTRVYLTGYSQTAGYVRGYANAISPFARRANGGPIFDGYLEAGHAPFNVPLNDCAPLYKPGDPRLLVGRVGVPFMDVASESDTLVNYFMRQPDGNRAPFEFRRYEVAGATHIGEMHGALPSDKESVGAGAAPGGGPEACTPAGYGLSDFPMGVVLDTMWQNLDAWVVKRISPPPGTRLVLRGGSGGGVDAAVAVEKDRFGNALGGWRTTVVDVPTATWHSSRSGPDGCVRMGYSVPFGKSMLQRLYPSHHAYVRKVDADVKRLVDGRWLTPLDASAIRRQAEQAAVP